MSGPVGGECTGPGPGCGLHLVFYLLSFPPAARPVSARKPSCEKVALITALALQGVVCDLGGAPLFWHHLSTTQRTRNSTRGLHDLGALGASLDAFHWWPPR